MVHSFSVNRVYLCCSFVAAVFAHPPVIREAPRNTTAVVGETVQFTCRFISDSQPNIAWLKHYQVNGSFFYDDGEPYVNDVYVGLP